MEALFCREISQPSPKIKLMRTRGKGLRGVVKSESRIERPRKLIQTSQDRSSGQTGGSDFKTSDKESRESFAFAGLGADSGFLQKFSEAFRGESGRLYLPAF